jgi:hypothetical protein
VSAVAVASDASRVLWTGDARGRVFSWALPRDLDADADDGGGGGRPRDGSTGGAAADDGDGGEAVERVVRESSVHKESARLRQYRQRWLVLTERHLVSYKAERVYVDPTEVGARARGRGEEGERRQAGGRTMAPGATRALAHTARARPSPAAARTEPRTRARPPSPRPAAQVIELSTCTAVKATDEPLMSGRPKCSFTGARPRPEPQRRARAPEADGS